MNMTERQLLDALYAERVLALAIRMAEAAQQPAKDWKKFIGPALGAVKATQQEIARLQAPPA